MKQGFVILLLVYFAAGIITLPLGDFSILPSLPTMYKHCKTFEHPDMSPIEFITDHLINIDGIFDKHDGDDDQRPHNPESGNYTLSQVFYLMPGSQTLPQEVELPRKIMWMQPVIGYHEGVIPSVFRPPMG